VNSIVRQREPFRWDGVPLLAYKADPAEAHFEGVTRQVLFGDSLELGVELRYFEVAAGGHTTLEQHEHVHAVMIVRGAGRCLVGDNVYDIAPHDLVSVPPHTWHQFRANDHEPLGFVCLVRCDRDRPRRPDVRDLERLRADPAIAGFIRA
jgi:S-methyl-1-thioxylulose 5-phosphate methylthiotransferase